MSPLFRSIGIPLRKRGGVRQQPFLGQQLTERELNEAGVKYLLDTKC